MKDQLILFLKENSCTNFYLLVAFIVLGMNCASSNQSGKQSARQQTSEYQPGFALEQQKAPPNDIQSIQLHPKGSQQGAPVIQLNSQEKLTLSFDYLGEQNRQFRLEVSHRTQQWEESNIPPSTYLESFSRTYIQKAQPSFSKKPPYFHVEYEFPESELRPAVSGNYLMEVYDYNSDELLFSVPFFITENEGAISTRVEQIFAQRKDGRSLHQLFSTYRYPAFVEYPQFDLSMSFVQNRFWGRMQEAGFLDAVAGNEFYAHQERQQAFLGNYEFKTLDLRSFDPDGSNIIDYRPGNTPPTVILRRDTQNLDTNPSFTSISELGLPVDDRSSNYGRVEFSLETDDSISPMSEIYIVGHFNNWIINSHNRMTYNAEQQLWTGHALIKQGEYAYKYVVADKTGINDLALDQGFLSAEQEYLTFVYFEDPDQHFDRLLKVDRISRR